MDTSVPNESAHIQTRSNFSKNKLNKDSENSGLQHLVCQTRRIKLPFSKDEPREIFNIVKGNEGNDNHNGKLVSRKRLASRI
jgi:hypothetical protein